MSWQAFVVGGSLRYRYSEAGIGSIKLRIFDEGWAYLEDLWVDPESRSQGHGSRFLKLAEIQAWEFGCSRIGCHPRSYDRENGQIVEHPASDDRLAAWYEARGWEPSNLKAWKQSWSGSLMKRLGVGR